jgi:hypothetical protein
LDWVATISLLQGWLDQWASIVAKLSNELLIALMVPAIVLSMVSRQWDIIAGCIVLTLSAFLVVISPSNAASILGTGLYIGSLVLALSAIFARRKAKNLEAELANLWAHVNALSTSEQRRILRDIRSSSKEAGIVSQASKK